MNREEILAVMVLSLIVSVGLGMFFHSFWFGLGVFPLALKFIASNGGY